MTQQAFLEDFHTLTNGAEGEESHWLQGVRRTAIDRFSTLGFPTTKNEDWHFTSVAPIAEADFRAYQAGGDVSREDLAPFRFGAVDWTELVFVNGRFSPELSALDRLP
ncbi:MAG TPA: hypothetical protein VJ812_03680, partial [Gemmatimonadaceae bacterium]|nr:hypothetical protein [Gemmatimonadaceae bacterium]